MSFRASINNLIRSDRPESPTDVIFLFGSLVLISLMVYATQARCTIPHFEAMLLALGGYKTVKVASNWTKRGNDNATACACSSPDRQVAVGQ